MKKDTQKCPEVQFTGRDYMGPVKFYCPCFVRVLTVTLSNNPRLWKNFRNLISHRSRMGLSKRAPGTTASSGKTACADRLQQESSKYRFLTTIVMLSSSCSLTYAPQHCYNQHRSSGASSRIYVIKRC